MRRIGGFVNLFFIAVLVARAAVLTPEQALKVRRISEVTFSADGVHLACTVEEPPKGAEHATHIWLLDTRTGEFRQFTSSAKSEHLPRWSPDGHTLGFLSDQWRRSAVGALHFSLPNRSQRPRRRKKRTRTMPVFQTVNWT